MFKSVSVIIIAFLLALSPVSGQSKKNDIPVNEVPAAVIEVLNSYAAVLGSESLEKCAEAFKGIAGGSLVNETGDNLRANVMQFSLKKDYSNFKFYAVPLQITRVNKGFSNSDGFGASALKGTVYKIWIAKKAGTSGMPAPISILVPENHTTIKSPKIVNIGSL